MTTVNGPDDQAAQRPFAEGDPALLVDRRGRRYLITLTRYKSFHTHVGAIDHNDLIGRSHGARLNTTTGHVLLAFSPTLGDFVEEMPHQTQVIYAKDLGAILMHGDIFPGARVLEAGLGSGALTIALLRAVGESGRVTTYEIRPELVEGAKANIRTLVPQAANLEVKLKDVYEGVEETGAGPHRAGRAGAVARCAACGHGARARRHLPWLPADHSPGSRALRGPGREPQLRDDGDGGGAHAAVVGHEAQRQAGSPHDRAHRLHHHGAQVRPEGRAGGR